MFQPRLVFQNRLSKINFKFGLSKTYANKVGLFYLLRKISLRNFKMKSLYERVVEFLPKWRKGLGGYTFENLAVEGKVAGESYTDEYIYLDGAYYESECLCGDGNEEYVDYAQLRYDFQKMIQDDMPDCAVKIQWECNEVEILKKTEENSTPEKVASPIKNPLRKILRLL